MGGTEFEGSEPGAKRFTVVVVGNDDEVRVTVLNQIPGVVFKRLEIYCNSVILLERETGFEPATPTLAMLTNYSFRSMKIG